MVVKEDGTKWACQSCLRGHRVSGCSHTDRPLVFVPKKGRPVTQCQHCRVERKKRSAHVKCDCGEAAHGKEKCIHLRDAEARHEELEPLPEDHELEDLGCCCHHGGKCTCATIKKDEDDAAISQPRFKPRLTSTQSDGHLTIFANGHHKPIHRNNHAAHELGLPYKMPRSHTDHITHNAARRSVDSLILNHNNDSGTRQRPAPVATANSADSALPQVQNANQGQGPSAPSSIPGVQSNTSEAQPAFPQYNSMPTDSFQGFGLAYPIGDATSSTDFTAAPATGTWSMAGSDIDPSYTNDDSWNNFDWSVFGNTDTYQPALTNASSGTLSEADELPHPDDTASFDVQGLIGNYQPPTTWNEPPMNVNVVPALQKPMPQGTVEQQNRWSLPASFVGSGNVNPRFSPKNQATLIGDSIEFYQSGLPSQLPTQNTASDMTNSAVLGDVAKDRSRPKAVYEKSNTLPTDLDWERFLQQCGGDNISAFGANSEIGNQLAPTSAPMNSASIDGSMTMPDDVFDLDTDMQGYQSGSSSQFPLTDDYLNGFDYNQYSGPDMDINWAS